MQTFCRLMLERLRENRRLHLSFAQREGEDVGYIFGAVFGGSYRGLQFSYVEEVRDIALGSAMQFHQIQRLCEQGVLEYDLGSTSPHYKQRWAEREVPSLVLILTAVKD
jgi:CelD/BcsL family acetyltransferase involved in cellulose biosynthesis